MNVSVKQIDILNGLEPYVVHHTQAHSSSSFSVVDDVVDDD